MHENLIGGEWVGGSTAVEDRNPSDLSDVVGAYAVADEAQVDAAIEAAVAAAPGWASSTPQERFTILETAGLELAARSAELGEQLSREEGKPRAEGIGEVQRAAQILRFFAGEALRIPGEHVRSVRPGVDVDILREPLGVVGVITPWNFPIAIPAWKLAPALAYGCTVVFKPAELVPASAWSLVEILSRAGLPPGVCNLVVGPGRVVGERLVHDPRVRGVTFTGSQAVGAGVASGLAARFGRYQLEMGGKNPLVILDDADLGIAVDCAVQGAFFQTGQRCTASSRLIATAGIHDRFVEATVARLGEMRVGHALADDTQIGPVVSADQLSRTWSTSGSARTRAPSSRSVAGASIARPRVITSSRRCSSGPTTTCGSTARRSSVRSQPCSRPRTPSTPWRSRTTPSSGCRQVYARRR